MKVSWVKFLLLVGLYVGVISFVLEWNTCKSGGTFLCMHTQCIPYICLHYEWVSRCVHLCGCMNRSWELTNSFFFCFYCPSKHLRHRPLGISDPTALRDGLIDPHRWPYAFWAWWLMSYWCFYWTNWRVASLCQSVCRCLISHPDPLAHRFTKLIVAHSQFSCMYWTNGPDDNTHNSLAGGKAGKETIFCWAQQIRWKAKRVWILLVHNHN